MEVSLAQDILRKFYTTNNSLNQSRSAYITKKREEQKSASKGRENSIKERENMTQKRTQFKKLKNLMERFDSHSNFSYLNFSLIMLEM